MLQVLWYILCPFCPVSFVNFRTKPILPISDEPEWGQFVEIDYL